MTRNKSYYLIISVLDIEIAENPINLISITISQIVVNKNDLGKPCFNLSPFIFHRNMKAEW